MQAHLTTWEDRFWAKVVEGDGGCWLWTAGLDRGGYGAFGGSDSVAEHFGTRTAHRIAYRLVVGAIPGDLTLDHLCRVRRCVNPFHLEPVSRGENVLRGIGPTAQNARKTHCPQGHPYSGDNLVIVRTTGKRHCRACNRENCRRIRLARAA